MPAKSKAQRRFMAMCEHSPGHAKGACPDMSVKEMHKYSSTPDKNLPERVSKRRKGKK